MKKTILILLFCVISLSLFAFSSFDLIKKDLPNTRYNIVGSVADASLFHVSNLMSSKAGAEALEELFSGKVSKNLINLFVPLLRDLSSGRQDMLNMGYGLGFSIKNFGLSLDMNADFDTTKDTDSSTGEEIIMLNPAANISLSMIYAVDIIKTDSIKFNANVAGHLNAVILVDGFDYTLLENEDDEKSIPFKGKCGLGYSFDAQASLINLNGLGCYIGVDNLLATNYLKEFNDSIYWSSFNFEGEKTSGEKLNVNAGISYSKSFSYTVKTALNARMNYINEVIGSKDVETDIKENLEIEACFNVKDIVDFSLGVYGGYLGASVSAGYNNNKLSVSYGWKESGESYGLAPVDYLTVSMSLGWKK